MFIVPYVKETSTFWSHKGENTGSKQDNVDRIKSDTNPALIFVPEGVRIIGTVYMNMLENNVLPWLKKCSGRKSYISQQDGVPAHTSKKIQQWCKENLSGFWDKLMRPSSNGLFYPVNFRGQSLQQKPSKCR